MLGKKAKQKEIINNMVFDDQVDTDTGDIGRVGFIVFFLILAVVAGVCAFIVFMPGALGWEEQLEGCRIRGIPPEECPDDESYVGKPYNQTPIVTDTQPHGSGGRTTRTRTVWVLSRVVSASPELACYETYKRIVQHYPGGVSINKDYRGVVMRGCINPRQYPINVVLP